MLATPATQASPAHGTLHRGEEEAATSKGGAIYGLLAACTERESSGLHYAMHRALFIFQD